MRYLPALTVLLAFSPVAMALVTEAREPLRARPVPFDTEDAARVRTGELTWLGGWHLTSGDRRFGGISALLADHGRFVAIGDDGNVMAFRLSPRGAVAGDPVFALADGPGTGARKSERDSESAARDPATARVWIGFENVNEIWRYDPNLRHAEAHVRPPEMAHWPSNGGAEALVRLRDGRFVVLAESATRSDESTQGLLYSGDPAAPGAKPQRFSYRAPEGYSATDAAELPDGRLLILNRRFTLMDGISAKLTVIDLQGLVEGSVLKGREIATLAPPLTVDNMEALAVERENGRTIVWIASDDNFSVLQRTLLLEFALDERE